MTSALFCLLAEHLSKEHYASSSSNYCSAYQKQPCEMRYLIFSRTAIIVQYPYSLRTVTHAIPAHVWLGPCDHVLQAGVAAITSQLKSYRPNATVLEAEVGKGPRGQAGLVMSGAATEGTASVMRKKRNMHDSAILVRTSSLQRLCLSCTVHQDWQ